MLSVDVSRWSKIESALQAQFGYYSVRWTVLRASNSGKVFQKYDIRDLAETFTKTNSICFRKIKVPLSRRMRIFRQTQGNHIFAICCSFQSVVAYDGLQKTAVI